jgi:hypothetical protein
MTPMLPSPGFSEPGSTGGSVGKTDKSVTGISSDTPQPDRRKGTRSTSNSVGAISHVTVTSATYGGNCGAPSGNVTRHLAQACNGKARCDYVIDYQIIGDPKVMCSKDYVAKWRCGDGRTRNASVPPEAGFKKSVSLGCE